MKLKQRLATLTATLIMATAVPNITLASSHNTIIKHNAVIAEGTTFTDATTANALKIEFINSDDSTVEEFYLSLSNATWEQTLMQQYFYTNNKNVQLNFYEEQTVQVKYRPTDKNDQLTIPLLVTIETGNATIVLTAEGSEATITEGTYLFASSHQRELLPKIDDLPVLTDEGNIATIYLTEAFNHCINDDQLIIEAEIQNNSFIFTDMDHATIKGTYGFTNLELENKATVDASGKKVTFTLSSPIGFSTTSAGQLVLDQLKVQSTDNITTGSALNIRLKASDRNGHCYTDSILTVANIKANNSNSSNGSNNSNSTSGSNGSNSSNSSSSSSSTSNKNNSNTNKNNQANSTTAAAKLEHTISQLKPQSKKEILENVDNKMPYTSLESTLTLETLKDLTNGLFTNEELQVLLKDPAALAEIGIDPSSTAAIQLNVNENIQFNDVKPSHWAHESLAKAAALGLINGTTTDTFSPAESLKVADTFSFLDRVLLLNGKTDMKLPRSTVEKYITDSDHWAFNHTASIASKLDENCLKTVSSLGEAPLSRELFAEVIYQITNGSLSQNTDTASFTDIQNSPYQEALNYCVQAGLLKGTGKTTMSPEKYLTRAEMMTVLIRLNEAFQ